MSRYVGSYVSVAGGLFTALERGNQLGINTIMVHPSPPQRWCMNEFTPEAIAKFNETRKQYPDIEKVFFHGIYLSNLANPDKQKWHLGKVSLVNYMKLNEAIEGDGVCFHTGTLKDTDKITGFAQVAKSLDWILKEAPGKSIIMLEVAAGGGSSIGAKLEDLAEIYDMVETKDRVAFCLDTQHMWASGYDWTNDLDGVVKQVDSILGLDKVKLIHLNDSKTPFDSKKDRHDNLGAGLIGESTLKSVLNHPKLKNIPFVLETPDVKDVDAAANETVKLLEWTKN